jgi:tetratricopeptide (TPR) repeat protein
MNVKSATAVINAEYLQQRIHELDYRIWWIAEKIHVDRGTISRWLSGRVKWVKMENLQPLAELLDTTVDALTVKSETEQLATPNDLKMAAELIQAKNMKGLVRQDESWQLLEYVIKASIRTSLPLNLLGSLYYDLGLACFFQNKVKQADEYTEKSLAIAQRMGNSVLLQEGWQLKAMIRTCVGPLTEAVTLYQQCLNCDHDPNFAIKVKANWSEALFRRGDLALARDMALQCLQDCRENSWYAVDHISLCKRSLSVGLCFLSLNELQVAQSYVQQARDEALKGSYQKGEHYCAMVLALIASRREPHADQAAIYECSHEQLRAIIDDQLYYAIGADIYAGIGDYNRSVQLIRAAIKMAKDFPVEQGLFYEELTRIEFRFGQHQGARRAFAKAQVALTQTAALPRLARLAALLDRRGQKPQQAAITSTF